MPSNPKTPVILSTPESKEYYFEEGCFILELENSDKERNLSIARARVKPGKTTKLHRLQDIIERYVIISGTGLVEIGDLQPKKVTAGDVVIIPSMCLQRIKNIDSTDLIFLVICMPRFRTENYQAIDIA